MTDTAVEQLVLSPHGNYQVIFSRNVTILTGSAVQLSQAVTEFTGTHCIKRHKGTGGSEWWKLWRWRLSWTWCCRSSCCEAPAWAETPCDILPELGTSSSNGGRIEDVCWIRPNQIVNPVWVLLCVKPCRQKCASCVQAIKVYQKCLIQLAITWS